MIAVESAHSINPNPGGRRPLQPRNIILSEPPSRPKPTKTSHVPSNPTNQFHKNNIRVDLNPIPIDQPMDASLADELNAVKKKLERLRLDREKTEKTLIDRVRMLDNQMSELLLRGEFQRELEIGVDRLYRLKELQLACMRRSPIRSLREKEMEKKNKETQSKHQSVKTGETMEESSGQSCSIESRGSSSEKTSNSTSTWTSSSTANSRKVAIPLRWSTENESEN